MPYRVDRSTFARLVEEALAEVPEPFAGFLEEVPLEIRDRPTPQQLESVGLEPDELLLGLYQGRPLTERSVEHSGVMPDVIYVFQEDIEEVCDTEDQLRDEVRITVLHEIGHHFGMSEEDLDALGFG